MLIKTTRSELSLLLPHAFLLLELDEDTGASLIQGIGSSVALAGAFFAELAFANRFMNPKANQFALRAVGESSGMMKRAEEMLPRPPFTQKRAISSLQGGWGRSNLRQVVLDDLVARGCLRAEVDRFLRIPYRWRWPNEDFSEESSVRESLRVWVERATDSAPPHREDALLSLLRVSKLLHVVWSEAELETLGPRITERTKRAPIGKVVKQVIQEQQAALLTATMASI